MIQVSDRPTGGPEEILMLQKNQLKMQDKMMRKENFTRGHFTLRYEQIY